MAFITMTSPSANHEAIIVGEKENSLVGIVEETQDTSYGTIHGERFEPQNDFLAELSATETPDDPHETFDPDTYLNEPNLDLDSEHISFRKFRHGSSCFASCYP